MPEGEIISTRPVVFHQTPAAPPWAPTPSTAQEAKNIKFCPSNETFHYVVLKLLRNISDKLEKRNMEFLV